MRSALLLVCCVLFSREVFAAGESAPPSIAQLTDVSVLDREVSQGGFLAGQWGQCSFERSPEVKAYPKLASDRPLFGTIPIGRDLRDPRAGTCVHFVIDTTEGAEQPYDRLYLDTDRDLDLTDEAPRGLWKDAPRKLRVFVRTDERVFERTRLAFALDGSRTVELELIVRLIDRGSGVVDRDRFSLNVLPATFRRGTLKIGGNEYTVRLEQNHVLTGRYDHGAAALLLTPKEDPSALPSWVYGDRLMAMHKLGGVLYRFSATPAGDTLTATPYTGDFGTFEIGKGGRTLDLVECTGSFMSWDNAVAVGGEIENGEPKACARAVLPVGDYLPTYMTVTYGRLQIILSQNYHADGTPGGAADRKPVFPIAIRKNAPFVLDFAAKPTVIFALPAKETRLKVGTTLEVKAVLADPSLGIMIRGLTDRTKTRKVEYDSPDGQKNSYEMPWSLDPTVTVARAHGEKVAEGIMPFG